MATTHWLNTRLTRRLLSVNNTVIMERITSFLSARYASHELIRCFRMESVAARDLSFPVSNFSWRKFTMRSEKHGVRTWKHRISSLWFFTDWKKEKHGVRTWKHRISSLWFFTDWKKEKHGVRTWKHRISSLWFFTDWKKGCKVKSNREEYATS